MLFGKKNGTQKRADFRKMLNSGKLLQFPGSYSPMVSMLIEQKGFDGVYISGAVLANDLGLPDIGMTTLTEVVTRGAQIARTTELPSFIDIDTGFGEPMSVVRTVQLLEEAGIAGCHLEDQVNPKRCGHLDNKSIVPIEEMVRKVKAAADGKRDPNFILIARTDARASEGLDAAIDRAKAYVDAGADMIFPEAMKDEKEFETFRKAINVPMLANMTEFGKSKILDKKTLEGMGFNVVIYPVTTVRLAMKNVEDGLDIILRDGSQEAAIEMMQTRKRLYEVLRYEEYNTFDKSLFNFKV
ncbi:MAG: methylisocitrate lyase [Bacteriovoracaceae bacterium]